MKQPSPPAVNQDNPYLTEEEATRYVNMKPETLRRRRRDGKVAYVPTRPPVYIRSELDRMMQQLTKKPKRAKV